MHIKHKLLCSIIINIILIVVIINISIDYIRTKAAYEKNRIPFRYYCNMSNAYKIIIESNKLYSNEGKLLSDFDVVNILGKEMTRAQQGDAPEPASPAR